ncbi:hypothetical protein ACSLUP_07290, partial [Streptococcus dysgalactiae]
IVFLICLKVAKVSPIIIMKVKEKTNWRVRPVCLQSERKPKTLPSSSHFSAIKLHLMVGMTDNHFQLSIE